MFDFCRLEKGKGATINLIYMPLMVLKTLSVIGCQLS